VSIRVLAGVALLVAAAAGPTAEGAAGPGPRTRRVGPHGTYPSVQAAADAARPGDTVAIEAGSYPGGLTVHRGGAPGHPIRFRGEGGIAVLTGAGGLVVGGHSWLEFTDVTVSGSTGFGVYAEGAHDLVFDRFTGTNTLRNNVFGDGPVDVGPFAADHDFTDDPGFADPAHGDYHLAAGSAAVDAGSPERAPVFDLDGAARPAGAGFDIGAYERRWP